MVLDGTSWLGRWRVVPLGEESSRTPVTSGGSGEKEFTGHPSYGSCGGQGDVKTDSSDSGDERTVEAYLRAGPVFGMEHQREAVHDRLAAMERAGDIARYDLRFWGRAVRPDGQLSDAEFQRRIVERVEEFERWLRDSGMDPAYTFGRHEVDSPVAGEHYEYVTLPAVCLAVYEGGELTCVSPCHDGRGTDTVDDCLARLESGEPAAVAVIDEAAD